MIIAATGHRKYDHDDLEIYEAVHNVLDKFNPEMVIVGMAQGFDMLVAQVALDGMTPYTAVHPWNGFGQSRFIHPSQEPLYEHLTNFAHKNIYLPGPVGTSGLFARNRYMVDNADAVLAYYNGKRSGTMHCVNYANKQGRKVRNIYEIVGK